MNIAEWEGEAATSEIIDREAVVASAIVAERNKVADEIASTSTAFDAAENLERRLRKYWHLLPKDIL